MRDLTRRAGTRIIPAWPPRWTGSFHPGAALTGNTVLASVTPANNTDLRLTIMFDTIEYAGILKWDRPPALDAVESLLKENIGREIGAIGDLDV
jgi:hypothetical protein